jgi:hypothetical protein
VIAVVAVLAIGGDPSVVPLPIGRGPAYRPAAASHVVPALACRPGGPSFRVHLELFAHRRVIVVPAGIGTGAGTAACVCTTAPTGVVEVSRGGRPTLGDLFRVWGRRLGERRLLSFASKAPVRAYVGGRRWNGAAAAIPLEPNAQIVVELGAYVPPHATYLFPRRSA